MGIVPGLILSVGAKIAVQLLPLAARILHNQRVCNLCIELSIGGWTAGLAKRYGQHIKGLGIHT